MLWSGFDFFIHSQSSWTSWLLSLGFGCWESRVIKLVEKETPIARYFRSVVSS